MRIFLLVFLNFVLVFVNTTGCHVLINPSPEIIILQNSTHIPSGSGEFDFGILGVGKSSDEVTFTIKNLGNTYLILSGTPTKIVKTGDDISSFTINQTSTKLAIPPEGSTTFTITFNPTSEGIKNSIISIACNVPDANPYTFTVNGKGGIPEINLKQDSRTLVSGDSRYYYGNVPVGNTSSYVTFTIENIQKIITKIAEATNRIISIATIKI